MLNTIEPTTMNESVRYSIFEDDMVAWVLGVDRRLILVKSMKKHQVLKASDIAQETNRSVQNVSRALNELMNRGLIRCLNPEKCTWKRYVLTDQGRELLKKINDLHI